MEKRIHTKKMTHLTYRHYLFHFKWPLMAFVFIVVFLSFLQLNLSTYLLPLAEYDDSSGLVFADAIYPVHIHDAKKYNTSICYYLWKKDQLKANDDLQSMNKKQKTILASAFNQSSRDSYLILEFTPVFGKPRFCSATREQIFGEKCPYQNWYVTSTYLLGENEILSSWFLANIHAIKHMKMTPVCFWCTNEI